LSAVSSILWAQTTLNVATYLVRDGNAYNSCYASREYINSSRILIQQRLSFHSLQLNAFYSPDYLYYPDRRQLNNNAHSLGISGLLSSGSYNVQINASARRRSYRGGYNLYDEDSFILNADLRYSSNLADLLQVGLTVRMDHYTNYSDLSNQSYKIYAKYQHFLRSRTGLTAEAGLGVKDYVNQSIFHYFGMSIDNPASPRVQESSVRAAMWSARFTVAQSLSARTGLSLGVGGQGFLGDPIRTYTGGIYYYTENDLYDDPYAYQDGYASLELTRQFAVDFQAKIGANAHWKRYSGTPALDANGELLGSMRRDQRQEYFLMLSKKIPTGWNFPSSISPFLNIVYRSNTSNDPYFSYHDPVSLIGITIGFLNPEDHWQ